MRQWHLPSLVDELHDRGYVTQNFTEEGVLALKSPDGSVATLPFGVGDMIEDALVKHALAAKLDMDDLFSAVSLRAAAHA